MGRGDSGNSAPEAPRELARWKRDYDERIERNPPQPVGMAMPDGAFVIGFDVIGSRGYSPLQPVMNEALRRIAHSTEISSWLPFRQANGDELWGIVADAPSLLAAIRLLLAEDGRFRAGLGFGYAEVNSAYFPRDYGYELAATALNKRAKQSGQPVEVEAPSAQRALGRSLGKELQQLVVAWKDGEAPDLAPALTLCEQLARETAGFGRF